MNALNLAFTQYLDIARHLLELQMQTLPDAAERNLRPSFQWTALSIKPNPFKKTRLPTIPPLET